MTVGYVKSTRDLYLTCDMEWNTDMAGLKFWCSSQGKGLQLRDHNIPQAIRLLLRWLRHLVGTFLLALSFEKASFIISAVSLSLFSRCCPCRCSCTYGGRVHCPVIGSALHASRYLAIAKWLVRLAPVCLFCTSDQCLGVKSLWSCCYPLYWNVHFSGARIFTRWVDYSSWRYRGRQLDQKPIRQPALSRFLGSRTFTDPRSGTTCQAPH